VQVQVFVSSLAPITETERADARKLLVYTHGVLVEDAAKVASEQASNDAAQP
jgi:hypothetical protein